MGTFSDALVGYDVIFEIRHQVLENKLLEASIGGISLNPPSAISLPQTSDGKADLLILNTLSVSFIPQSNGVHIEIPFEDSNVNIGYDVHPLKGKIIVQGTLELADIVNPIPADQGFSDLMFFVHQTPTIQWDAPSGSAQRISALSPADADKAAHAITLPIFLGVTTVRPRAGLRIKLDTNQSGYISPAPDKTQMSFCQVDVWAIDSDTLVLFCVLLKSTYTLLGSSLKPSARTSPSLLANNEEMGLLLSPAAFGRVVFCPTMFWSFDFVLIPPPALAAAKTDPQLMYSLINLMMPANCGSQEYGLFNDGSGISRLVKVEYQLGQGAVSVHVEFKQDADCIRWGAKMDTSMIPSVQGHKVVVTLNPNPPKSSVGMEFDWYCFIPAIVVSLVSYGILPTIIAGFVSAKLSDMIVDAIAPKKQLNQPDPKDLGNMILPTAVNVAPDGFEIAGTVPPPPPSKNQRSVKLVEQMAVPTHVQLVKSGIFHFPGSQSKFVNCPAKDYHWQEYTQQWVVILKALPTLMGQDVQFDWFVNGNHIYDLSDRLLLEGVAGTLPQPGDRKGDSLNVPPGQVEVDYQFSSDFTELTLTGNGSLNYALNVEVICRSYDGYQANDSRWEDFHNRYILMLDNYDQDMALCDMATKLLIDKLRLRPVEVPIGGDPGELNYDQTVAILRQGLEEQTPGLQNALEEGIHQFGQVILKDVLKPKVKK